MNTGRAITVKFPGEPPDEVDRPFDRVYLIDNVNLHGEYLDQIDDVHRMISQQVFLEAASHVGAEHWNRDVNLTEEVVGNGRAHSAVMAYSSFATASLILPIPTIRAKCLEKLTDKLILRGTISGESIRHDKDLDNSPVSEEADRLMQSLEDTLSPKLERSGAEFNSGPETEATNVWGVEGSSVQHEGESDRELSDRLLAQTREALARIIGEAIGYCGQHGMRPAAQVIDDLIKKINDRVGGLVAEAQHLSAALNRSRDAILRMENEMHAGAGRHTNWRDIVGSITGRGHEERWAELTQAIAFEREKIATYTRDLWFTELKQDSWGSVRDGARFLLDEFEYHIKALESAVSDLINTNLRSADSTVATDRAFDLVSYIDDPKFATLSADNIMAELHLVPLTITTWNEKYLKQFCDFEVYSSQAGPDNSRTLAGIRLPIEESETHARNAEIEAFIAEEVNELIRPFLRNERIVDYLGHRYGANPRLKGAPEDPLRLLFDRCYPFWKINPDLGFSEGDMETVPLVGVDNVSEQTKHLFEDYNFDLVATGSPDSIELSVGQHGLPLEYLGDIKNYQHCYDELRALGEVLHLHKDWEENGLDGLE